MRTRRSPGEPGRERAIRRCPRHAALAGLLLAVASGCRPAAPPPDVRAVEAWSPTVTDLLVVSNRDGNSEIYLRRGAGGAMENLTRHTAGDNWPEWSPDAGTIAFQSNRTGNLDIYVMREDGRHPVQLTDHREPDYLPAWTPDGRRITFVSWRREEGDTARAPHVYIMNADGSGQRRLIARSIGTSASASWSPDGRRLAFSRAAGGLGAHLYLSEGPDSLERRLTDGPGYHGAVAFSPDGSRLAFYADHDSVSTIDVVDVDGGGRRTVVADGRNWYPRWSPDGRWLVYVRAMSADFKDLDLFAVPVDGGEPIPLATGPTRETEGRWRPHP